MWYTPTVGVPEHESKAIESGGSRRKGARRHLEGWQLGALSVGIALVGVVFGVPRPVPPSVLPVPTLDAPLMTRIMSEDAARVARAHAQPLSYEVRLIGETFRSYGKAMADRDLHRADRSLRELLGRTKAELDANGTEALLTLRAVQTDKFLGALREFERSGVASAELTELGDRFVAKAHEAQWLRDGRFLLTEAERFVLFRVRYSSVLKLETASPFALSAEEWRTYYRFLLEHPEPGGEVAAKQLALIEPIERVDLRYPGAFARGVLLHRLGRHSAAEHAFRAHLEQHPTGAWRLRAQNHLAACVLEVQRASADML